MLRKGIVDNIAAIMLVVISIATVASTINSIQDHTLDDSSEGLMDSLEQYNPEVTIENEEQFRGLTTWNLLASQQCIYANMIYNEEVGDIPGDVGIKEENLVMEPTESYEKVRSDSGYYTFFSETEGGDNPLQTVIEETAFQGQCMGAEPIAATRGPGAVVDEYTPELFNSGLKGMAGYSVEGRYGEVAYNMNETVIVDNPELFAMRLNEWWWGNDMIGGVASPDFVRGQRAAVFVPPNDPEQIEYDEEYGGYSGGAIKEHVDFEYLGEWAPGNPSDSKGISDYTWSGSTPVPGYWAFRVRMLNIPIIIDGAKSDIVQPGVTNDFDDNYEEKKAQQFEEFVQSAEYVLCAGSEGNIRSNAGEDPMYGGVVRKDNPVPRDVVYPKVEAFSGANSCIDDVEREESLVLDYFGSGRYTPIGNEMYFGENQELNREGLNKHISPDFRREDGNFYSKDYGNLTIGKYGGDYIEMPVKSVLTNNDDLGLEWLETPSPMIYTREFAVDTDECPRSGLKYDISEMFRSDSSYSTADEDGVVFSGGSKVKYPVQRFNSEDLEINFSVNPEWGDSQTRIVVTAYSKRGKELSSTAYLDSTVGDDRLEERAGSNYKISGPSDDTISSDNGQVGGLGPEVNRLSFEYSYEKNEVQSLRVDRSYPNFEYENLYGETESGDWKLDYITIEAQDATGSVENEDPTSFTVENFDVEASPAGCEPVTDNPRGVTE